MTATTTHRAGPRQGDPKPPRDRERLPMVAVLGGDIQPGDRIGSFDQWPVKAIEEAPGGTCATSAFLVAAGQCPCYRATDPGHLPRRIAVGEKGKRMVIYSHLRYSVVA